MSNTLSSFISNFLSELESIITSLTSTVGILMDGMSALAGPNGFVVGLSLIFTFVIVWTSFR